MAEQAQQWSMLESTLTRICKICLCFARSSDAFAHFLLVHVTFGPSHTPLHSVWVSLHLYNNGKWYIFANNSSALHNILMYLCIFKQISNMIIVFVFENRMKKMYGVAGSQPVTHSMQLEPNAIGGCLDNNKRKKKRKEKRSWEHKNSPYLGTTKGTNYNQSI